MKLITKTIWLAVLLCAIITVLCLQSKADAAWTLTPSKVPYPSGHYIKWKVLCTGDGSALAATDILPLMPPGLLKYVLGGALMEMKVSPGIGAVIPDNTFDVTLSDEEGDALWASTGISKDVITWFDLSEDIAIFPPITGKLYLTISDIGTTGDQVTLYFITWQEEDK